MQGWPSGLRRQTQAIRLPQVRGRMGVLVLVWKLADQELNLFLRFNAMAKNMKTFSNFYISPYGPRRNIIDENLKKTLQRFFLNRLGKRTTVIVKSFNPYPTDDEDEVNPTFAIRYCDEIRLKLGAKRHIVLANTERLMTTERMDNLVESLIDPSIPSPTNELYPVNSTCELLNNINCFCMKQLNKTTFEGSAQDKFIEKAWKDFEQIVESIGCFGEVEKSDVQFYHYHSHVKGEFYLAEFKAQITSSTNSTRTYEGQRSWKFYQNFQGAHGYGTIRLRMSDDSTTIIDKKFC
ncbi:unnamed protein product [Caenorhabditis angaria]|uniref:Uncharacterized protein n=1 Tax=Caenorhabditis angaria TaxID=860376 RepID=A0A9P1J119_9PELO|nr:unnamed protein product [Caenorhabditis angaria]